MAISSSWELTMEKDKTKPLEAFFFSYFSPEVNLSSRAWESWDLFLLKPLCSALAKCWIPPSAFPLVNLLLLHCQEAGCCDCSPGLGKHQPTQSGKQPSPRAVFYPGSAQQLRWPRAWWWGSAGYQNQLAGQADALRGNCTVCTETHYTLRLGINVLRFV